MPQRPILTAQWRNLLLLNFPVPTDVIERLAPRGTEPDLHLGQSFISIVGFQFLNTRFFSLPFPAHTNFVEINLRYYVRRTVGNELRRGVVFAREIAPRRAIALIANRLYHENYVTRPIRSDLRMAGAELAPGDTIAYSWKTRPLRTRDRRFPLPFRDGLGEGSSHVLASRQQEPGKDSSSNPSPPHWNQLAATVAAPLAIPSPDSLEEFIVEHYWGYSHGRDGQTREYRVEHNPWRVAAADNIVWDCDVAATYNPPLAEFLNAKPATAFIADGCPIQLYRGQKI